MNRRIVAAILVSVWGLLLVGGLAAYWATRWVMLAELDDSIVARAMTLPQLGGDGASAGASAGASMAARPAEYTEDRWLIADARGKTVARVPLEAAAGPRPRVISRAFAALPEGRRMRTLTMLVPVSPSRAADAEAAAISATDAAEPATVTLIYSAPATAFDTALGRLAAALAITGLVSGAAAAAVAVVVARRALRPLHAAADVIGTIDEHRLDRRIDADALPPELRPVARRLNDMLANLEQGFRQRQRFLADASHELRTPVAALVTTLEVALRRPVAAATQEQLYETLQRCLSDAGLLRELVQRLLEQVRSEQYGDDESPQLVRVDELLDTCATHVAGLAQQRHISLDLHRNGRIALHTQPGRLRSIVLNLLTNAIEHNHPGGSVQLSCETGPAEVVVVVKDDGPGIAAEHLAHVFEPFYRGLYRGRAPGEDDQHLGLGLFLVQTHAKALGGRCELVSRPGAGTTARVVLPRAIGADAAVEAMANKPALPADIATPAIPDYTGR